MSENKLHSRPHSGSRAPAIATAVILGAIALTPVALKSFGNDAQVAKIGNVKTTTASSSTINDKSPEINKVGYSVGYVLGTNAKQDAADLNTADIQQGLADAYEGKNIALTPEQMEKTITTYLQNRQSQAKTDQTATDSKSLQEGQAFLVENGKKAGMKTTASGLQYEVLKEGTGAKPKATDMVSVNYEGKTLDGKVFDSTAKRGEPAEFTLADVIPGWTEGVQLMTEGAKYRFYIPSNLAYGGQGVPQAGIPGNSVLTFDIELLKILPASAAKAPSAEEQAQMQAQMQAAIQAQMQGQAQAQTPNQGQATTTTTTTQTTEKPAN